MRSHRAALNDTHTACQACRCRSALVRQLRIMCWRQLQLLFDGERQGQQTPSGQAHLHLAGASLSVGETLKVEVELAPVPAAAPPPESYQVSLARNPLCPISTPRSRVSSRQSRDRAACPA